MYIKPFSVVCMIVLALVVQVSAYAQQCAISRTGQNLCNGGQTSYLSNTSNSITIYETGITPVTGTYNVTISYYDQGTNACAPQIACSGTVSASGTTTTISLSGCSALPDLSAAGITYIDLQSAANSYFFHIYGGACMLPLPIDLTAFSLQRNGNTINVMWTTAQESNASGVYIERNSVAGSGVTDMDIGFVPATNTSTPHSYTFVDQYPLNGTSTGTNYYRLRMVDLNGTTTYSKIVYTSCSGCTATPPLVDCGSQSISGPSYLCSGSANYSINSSLFYNKITWSVDNSSYLSLSTTSGNATTATVVGRGDTYISLNQSRCTYATANKSMAVEAGPPLVTGQFFPSSNTGGYENLVTDMSGTNYTPPGNVWVFPNIYGSSPVWTMLWGTVSSWSASGSTLQFYMPSGGDVTFQIEYTSEHCGQVTEWFTFEEGGYASSIYTLSPNPASSQLSVYVDDQKLSKMNISRSSGQSIQQVIVTDKMGNAVMTQKYAADTRNISLNIASLRPDVYTIRIFNGKKWETKKFIKR